MITDSIKLEIRRKGLTYVEFAKQIGISRQGLHSLLAGKYLPQAATLDKIAKGLGWSRRRVSGLLVDRYIARTSSISKEHDSADTGGPSSQE